MSSIPRLTTAPPAQTGWTQIELRSVTVDDGPAVPATVAGFVRLARQLGIGQYPLEEVWVAAVDATRIRSISLIARGQHHTTSVPLPAVLAVPLLAGVDRLVLLHTHPSGPLVPSEVDLELTRRVVVAANACGIWVADHLIVGRDGRLISLRALGHLE
jgi:hypothetical protein